MEIIQLSGNRKKRGYNRVSPSTNRRNLKIVRLKGSKRSWRLRLSPKLRLMRVASPLKLWSKFKTVYMKMMLRFANIAGTSNAATAAFGARRIPKPGQPSMEYSRSEFENRLILEIYKSMSASLELGHNN